MISFTLDQLYAWIGQFLWPFARISALIGASPLFSESGIPTMVKIGLAFMLSVIIAPTLGPMPAIPLNSYEALWLLGQQLLIGLSMGLVMRIVFASVQTAGEFIGLQMGLSFASLFDPLTGANTAVVSRLINILAMLIFLAFDGHLMMLSALVRSFEALPIAVSTLDANGWGVLTQLGNTIFSSGLLLALPVICALLTMNLAMGILNRAAPQLTVFAVGFPISLMVGLTLLAVVLPRSSSFFESQFQQALETIGSLVQRLAGH